MKCILKVSPPVSSDELNALFSSVWPNHQKTDFRPILDHALVYVCAFEGERLVGFTKVVGDGGIHGFLLDPTVAPDRQRNGIGQQMAELCADEARRKGVEWLHVDYEPRLKDFYDSCGFSPSAAGLRNLNKERPN